MGRYTRLAEITRLDPEVDYERIYRMDLQLEFPWDLTKALEFALFRTYAVPSIGRLLNETREFEDRPQKRYDDTGIVLYEAGTKGLEEPGGRAAMRQLNRIHGRYDISNEDYRYVLSTFVVMPGRWLDAYGWRPFHPVERRAATNSFRRIGELMGIKDIPETYAEFEELLDTYERDNFAFDPGSKKVAEATLKLFGSWYPHPFKGLAAKAPLALLDEHLARALGLPVPPQAIKSAASLALKARARALRLFPARPDHRPYELKARTYPHGWDITRIGPEWSHHPTPTPDPS
ncbi:MAG: DUF2236 domain-containing protein [Streptosporangiales bacterium]|nr:DUF2236 domain-containing protein [Streptosporangiales bacterium]